jgi:peroxiredoxin Q/BCP
LNTVVFGISKDSIKSHINFSNKLDLNFRLLSDEDKEVHKLYETWQPKKLYGKEYFGTVRSTFIVDEKGIVIKEYRKVKVKGHVEEVLNFIKNLNN